MTDEENLNPLYKVAQDWYLANPGQQIPSDTWRRECNVFDESKMWEVFWPGHHAYGLLPRLVPVLAAIGAGKTGHDLLLVIDHHEMVIGDLVDCYLEKTSASTEQETAQPQLAPLVEMSAWKIIHETIEAMSLSQEKSDQVAKDLWCQSDKYDYAVALALSSNKKFWPSTVILENKYKVIQDRVTNSPTPAFNIDASGADFDTLSNEQILDFLEHSGNLLPCVTYENGFHTDFAKTLFMTMDRGDGINLSRVVDAINSIEDPAAIARMESALLGKLIQCDYYRPAHEGIFTLRGIEKSLDASKYPRIARSMILKVKMVPEEGLSKLLDTEPDQMAGDCFEELINRPHMLLSRLAEELLDIDLLNFRKGHFEAIGAMAEKWRTPQELSNVDTMRLIGHTASALAAYKSQRHIDFMKGGCTGYQDRATSQVITFITWLAPQTSIDYACFVHLESSAKAILAKAGFDYKKLPGMTYRDKGSVLSEALGM